MLNDTAELASDQCLMGPVLHWNSVKNAACQTSVKAANWYVSASAKHNARPCIVVQEKCQDDTCQTGKTALHTDGLKGTYKSTSFKLNPVWKDRSDSFVISQSSLWTEQITIKEKPVLQFPSGLVYPWTVIYTDRSFELKLHRSAVWLLRLLWAILLCCKVA